MLDQAHNLRLAMQQRFVGKQHTVESASRVIAVTSGKGGVGKTSIAVNLGLALAKAGKRVVLVDADLGLANAEVLLGTTPPFSLFDVLYRGKDIGEVVWETTFGLKLVSGGSGIQEMTSLDQAMRSHVLESFKRLGAMADFLLIDTGAGINKTVLGFVAAAREVLFVVTPEPTSITDAYALMKVLAENRVRTGASVVVNRARNNAEGLLTAKRLASAAGRFLDFQVSHAGTVVDDAVVAQAVRDQEPFIVSNPKALASRNIEHIALTLAGEGGKGVGAVESFVNRLYRLFA